MIAQILERGEHIISDSIAGRNRSHVIDVGHRKSHESILELEHDSFGGLATDAGYARQACNVTPLNGHDKLARLDA